MQIGNGIIQFNPIQKFYLGRIIYEINTVDNKKYRKTILKLKFKNIWV